MRQQIVLEQEDLRALREGKPLAMTFADGRVVTIILESEAAKAERGDGRTPKTARTYRRRKNVPSEDELKEYELRGGVKCPELGCGQILKGNRLNDAKGSLRRHMRTIHAKGTAAGAPEVAS